MRAARLIRSSRGPAARYPLAHVGRLRRNKERKGKGEEACSSRLNNLARAFPSCRRDIPTPSLTMLLSTLCLSLLPLLLADRPSFSPPYPIDPSVISRGATFSQLFALEMISPPVACRESTNHPIAREQIVDSRLFPRALLLPGHRPLFLSPRKKKLQGNWRNVFFVDFPWGRREKEASVEAWLLNTVA